MSPFRCIEEESVGIVILFKMPVKSSSSCVLSWFARVSRVKKGVGEARRQISEE
jgi:hypothetical protein